MPNFELMSEWTNQTNQQKSAATRVRTRSRQHTYCTGISLSSVSFVLHFVSTCTLTSSTWARSELEENHARTVVESTSPYVRLALGSVWGPTVT
jgi:hypothetical protein